MRRPLAAFLVLVLAAALLVPAVAYAKKGGVPAKGAGHGRAAQVERDEDCEAPAAAEKGKGRNAAKGSRAGREIPRNAGAMSSGSDEATAASVQRRTGIANALSRLQRNLARMQARLDAGRRSSLPPGLERVIAKFMAWLGIGGEVAPPADEGGGSEETTGSVEPTGSVAPTGSAEPAVEPEG